MNITLRVTTLADTAALPVIERPAGQRFLPTLELAWIAEDQILSAVQHQTFVATSMSWLAQVDTLPVGFLVAETLGSSLSTAGLSLHLEQRGRGTGRRLIEYVTEQARRRGYMSLMLTTPRGMTWNAPRCARLGFETLADEILPAKLRQKREEEAAHGLAFESCCAMRLMLHQLSGGSYALSGLYNISGKPDKRQHHPVTMYLSPQTG